MTVGSRSYLTAVLAAGALSGALVAAAPAAAQTAAPDSKSAAAVGIDSSPAARGRAALVGRIHSAENVAVADAELTVLGVAAGGRNHDEGRTVRTGSAGEFRVDGITPGRYFVRVRRLGFEPLVFAATLDDKAPRRIDVELKQLPTTLSEVKVKAQSGFGSLWDRRLREFDERRRAGFGRFYTRDDLRGYEGRSLSDAISYLTPFGGCRGAGYFGRSGWGYGGGAWGAGDRCTAVSIDGGPALAPGFSLDIPMNSVEAVEVYRGGFAPFQFTGGLNGFNSGATVVVVWTGTETDDR